MGFPRTLLSWMLVFCCTTVSFAQMSGSGELENNSLEIKTSSITGLASMLTGQNGSILPLPADLEKPLSILSEYGIYFGISDGANELKRIETVQDDLGQRHHRYQQMHRGIEVFTGRIVVHQNREGEFLAVNGDFYPIRPGVATQPLITIEEAEFLVEAELGLVNPVFTDQRLVLVDPGWYGDPSSGQVRLAWHITASGDDAFGKHVFVDARNREVFDHWPAVHSAVDRKIYDGSGGSLPGNLVRGEGAAETGDAELDNLYEYVGDFHRLLLEGYNRDSIDGAGTPLVSTGRWNSNICPNAIWNGSGTAFCSGLATDDIVGHEFGHGLVDFTADLIYQNQSGQLNESFADVFGELVDLYNGDASEAGPPGGTPWPGGGVTGTDTPNTARGGCNEASVRWMMGEDSSLGAIRDMWSPTCKGDPDRALSPLYESTCCDPGFDSGGVHFGSGVSNHAFAMLTDGKTFNGFTIQSLGAIKTGAIWYRALSVYLTPASDFNEAFNAFVQAANDLVGTTPSDPRTGGPSAAPITAADVTQVTNALTAVEMNASGICALPPAPSNDDCAGSVVISPGLHDIDNRGATNSGVVADESQCAGTFLGQVSRDVWYSYSPPQSGTITVSTCNIGGFDSDLLVYSGNCGNLVQQGCNGDASGCSNFTSTIQDLPVTGGVSYLIRVGSFGTSGGVGQFDLSFAPGGGNPIEICNNSVDDDGDGAIDCNDTDCAADPACSGTPTEDCSNGVDDDGDGQIDCADADCSSSPACNPVSGDECLTAVDAFLGTNPVNTTTATTSSDASDSSQCSGTFLGGFHSDVWYRFVAPQDGLMTASLCGFVDFDSDLAVYQGGCAALSQVGCNGDGSGCVNLSSIVTDVPVSAGTEYMIRVGGWSETAAGTGNLEITVTTGSQENCTNGTDDDQDGLIDCEDPDCSAEPSCTPFPGDECNTSLPLILGFNFIDNTGASDSAEGVPSCSGSFLGAMSNDTWYDILVNQDGLLTISACDIFGYDSSIVLYSGSCGNLIPLACDGDSCGGLGAIAQASVTAGQVIKVRIGASVSGAVSSGDIQVSLQSSSPENCQNGIDDDLDGLADCLDPDCAADPSCTCESLTGLVCVQGTGIEVNLSWTNGELYDEIRVSRNGNLVAILGGTATSFLDGGGFAGNRVYAVTGVCSQSQSTSVCVMDVVEPSGFNAIAPLITSNFDAATGIGSVELDLFLSENSDNPGFPGDTQGFSLSLANDASWVTPVSVTATDLLQQLNGSSGPDFFTENIYTDGINVGVVYSFAGNNIIEFANESAVVHVSYNTVAANLVGAVDNVVTPLTWSENVGPVPVENLIVVNGTAITLQPESGSITLIPELGVAISRADCNSDGSFNIADAVTSLDGLFNGGLINCVDACDSNDDGLMNIADSVFSLAALFNNGILPPPPFGSCGIDPTDDSLTCEEFDACP